jgi:hypothetical protein
VRTPLKNLAIAILPAAILGVIIFVFASRIDPLLATGLGFIPLTVFNKVSDALERRDAKRSLATDRPTMIHSFAGFAISWPILLVYGALLLFAIAQVVSGLGAFIATVIAVAAAGPPDAWASKAEAVAIARGLFIIIPLMLIGGYLVGRWIGTRSAQNGIAVILMSAAVASILSALFDFFYLSFLTSENVILPEQAAQQAITNFGIFSLSSLVGYWRGQRQKLSRYLQYLLSVLPNDSRDVVVELAFEEARRVGATSSPGV